jgi:hypothetical protein
MGRPSKLTPAQWQDVERRILAGETVRSLAREFGVSSSAIGKRCAGISGQSDQVKNVAEKLADAENALRALPAAQRQVAIDLSEKLRSISASLASAAELGARTAHRLQALANSEVAKVDDAEPMTSLENLKGVSALTKLANDSAAIALNLLAANKDTVKQLNDRGEPPEPGLDPSTLSTGALVEIMHARDAAVRA